jgi:hypothetical protein
MSLSAYLWGIRLFTLLSFSAWTAIIFSVDPRQAGVAGVSLFFVSLFAALTGILTLGVTWFYRKGLGDEGAAHNLGIAFRQAVLLGIFMTLIAFFQYERIFVWWVVLLTFAAILLVEFSFRQFLAHDTQESEIR